MDFIPKLCYNNCIISQNGRETKMKRITDKLLALLLVCILVVSLCACQSADNFESIPSSGSNALAGTGTSQGNHTHTYTDEVIAPTCTENGYTIHTCACGESYADAQVAAIGHAFGQWQIVTEPTASSAGKKERQCSSCGEKETVIIGINGCGDEDSAHSDINNDGLCDTCKIDVLETIDFYNFNDLHGKFDDTDSQPGVDELTTFLLQAKQTDEHTVILSTGDMWQGSSESNSTKGMLITEWMNYLGVEAMALGNHEFDWGQEYIASNAKLAEFPFLAINVYDGATNKRAEYCKSSVMISRGGAQIGLIGAIGDCYSSIAAEMTKGLYFKVGSELTELVKAESLKLREAGADVIVYLIHDGGSYQNAGNTTGYYDQALSSGGYVDLVFEGHSHSYYIFTDAYGVPHLQGGGDNKKGITHVEMNVNFANGEVAITVTEYIDHSDCAALPDAEIVDQLLEKYWDKIGAVYRELGQNSKYRSSAEIGRTVARLYYEAGIAKWGNEYDIVLAGGSINTRSPYDIQSGMVKYSDLQMILPFDNKVMLCKISGRNLIDKFFKNSKYYIYSELSVSDIDPKKEYYIIADTWTSGYDWVNCTEIACYGENIFARDLLADYIAAGNWK